MSDHCPQLVRFDSRVQKRGLFKFYNVIADHDQFEYIVREEWKTTRSSNLLMNIWLKCQKIKEPLKSLNAQ